MTAANRTTANGYVEALREGGRLCGLSFLPLSRPSASKRTVKSGVWGREGWNPGLATTPPRGERLSFVKEANGAWPVPETAGFWFSEVVFVFFFPPLPLISEGKLKNGRWAPLAVGGGERVLFRRCSPAKPRRSHLGRRVGRAARGTKWRSGGVLARAGRRLPGRVGGGARGRPVWEPRARVGGAASGVVRRLAWVGAGRLGRGHGAFV